MASEDAISYEYIYSENKDSYLCRKRYKFTGHRPTPRRQPLPRPGRTGGFAGSGTNRRISHQSRNGIERNSPSLSRTSRFFVNILINNVHQNNPLIRFSTTIETNCNNSFSLVRRHRGFINLVISEKGLIFVIILFRYPTM